MRVKDYRIATVPLQILQLYLAGGWVYPKPEVHLAKTTRLGTAEYLWANGKNILPSIYLQDKITIVYYAHHTHTHATPEQKMRMLLINAYSGILLYK